MDSILDSTVLDFKSFYRANLFVMLASATPRTAS